MAEKNKSGFHTVGDTDMEEYNRKIKEHRRKVLRRTVIVTADFLLVLTGLGLYMALRHYENYDIMSTAERSDTDATHFTEFQGNIFLFQYKFPIYQNINQGQHLICNFASCSAASCLFSSQFIPEITTVTPDVFFRTGFSYFFQEWNQNSLIFRFKRFTAKQCQSTDKSDRSHVVL